jgi:exoribonuclease-2
LDLIVAEAMILANSTWGQWMGSLGVPAIYRSQASLAPGIKVRMGTKALPHAGIGVPSYAWSTSPLRRYTDLVNQWQLIACVRHGATAALVAPFKPKDAELFGIISGFETAYTAYNTHQSSMERFWTMQHLQQQAITELDASVFKSFPGEPPMARANTLPLVFSVSGAPPLDRGSQIRVRISAMDLIALDVHAQFLHSLDVSDSVNEADDEEEVAAGPLHIAVDLSETTTEEPQA